MGAIAAAILAGCLTAFYALPVYGGGTGRWLPLRVGLFVLALIVTGCLLARQVVSTRHVSVPRARAQWLFAGICVTVVLFATAYYALAVGASAQISGIRTKTDALYFAVTVLTTVGFGDVHATGQAARGVVTVQMAFDVLFVATAGSALRASSSARRAARAS
ncbi:potassium channel family protein [Parafrankia discariae]|uniref:potassium channel family protein n=1 Tax=Parafrankia discariae TaxID=365528 RepID=UPI000363E89A|nr:potassium channel family protein [Parafrankia discariae]